MKKLKQGFLIRIQSEFEQIFFSFQKRDKAPIGFLSSIMTFPDETPLPKNPYKWPEGKRGRPSKEVLKQRKDYNDWFHENITIPMQKQKEDNPPTIKFQERGTIQ